MFQFKIHKDTEDDDDDSHREKRYLKKSINLGSFEVDLEFEKPEIKKENFQTGL